MTINNYMVDLIVWLSTVCQAQAETIINQKDFISILLEDMADRETHIDNELHNFGIDLENIEKELDRIFEVSA